MLSEPLSATPAWRTAVTAADGRCQCHGVCGRKHPAGQGACTARHNVGGTHLHLAEDGHVYCKPCFHTIAGAGQARQRSATAQANAEKFPQGSLFAL